MKKFEGKDLYCLYVNDDISKKHISCVTYGPHYVNLQYEIIKVYIVSDINLVYPLIYEYRRQIIK